MSPLQDVTDASFAAEVLEADRPVVVDFWGDHCPACIQIAPILDALAAEHGDAVKFVKIHAAENARTSARYGVRAMPTVLAFAGGAVRGQLVGARPRKDFEALLEAALTGA